MPDTKTAQQNKNETFGHRFLNNLYTHPIYKKIFGSRYDLQKSGFANPDQVKKRDSYPVPANILQKQLYDAIIHNEDLKDKKVLEIDCGTGEGAQYITEHFQTRSTMAVDRKRKVVKLCTKTHKLPNLKFLIAQPENLPFAAHTYDSVINIETSNQFQSLEKFLIEVFRVLKPGGHFIFADFRNPNTIKQLENQFSEKKFKILEKENISHQIIAAIKINNEFKKAQIKRRYPEMITPLLLEINGVRQSQALYEQYISGRLAYFRYTLEK